MSTNSALRGSSLDRFEELMDYLDQLDRPRTPLDHTAPSFLVPDWEPEPQPQPEPAPADLSEDLECSPDPMNQRRIERKRRRVRRRGAFCAVLALATLWAIKPEGNGSLLGAPAASPYALRGRDAHTSLIAQARSPRLAVFSRPDRASKPTQFLDHPTPTGAPLVFLVVDDSDADWLQVQLPVRPNGATGWIRRDDVTVRATRYRVQVLLGAHRLELYDGPELVFQTRVAVGTNDTPTPGGHFFIKELIKPTTADTVYGNYVFGLSGFSNILERFNGGEGVIGIHGTNDPSAIGRDVSHGCIRLTNAAMGELVGRLPLGTPVDIVA